MTQATQTPKQQTSPAKTAAAPAAPAAQQPQSDFEALLQKDFKISAPRLPYPQGVRERFGIDQTSWRALVEAIFPNASTVESVILALSYCRSRKLDVMKKPVQIVPIWSKAAGKMVDTIWPGIGELRTTAFRTGLYAGRDRAEFGPTLTEKLGNRECTFPEWCEVTVYRLTAGQRVAFVGPRVHWKEAYATERNDSDVPNNMWATRAFGQIEKCAEAASLRAAFPEEIGDYIPEELGRTARVELGDGSGFPTSRTERVFGATKPAAPAPDYCPICQGLRVNGVCPSCGENPQHGQRKTGRPKQQPAATSEPAPATVAAVPTWDELADVGVTYIADDQGITVQNADGATLRPDGQWDDNWTGATVKPNDTEHDAIAREMAAKALANGGAA